MRPGSVIKIGTVHICLESAKDMLSTSYKVVASELGWVTLHICAASPG